MNLEHLLDKKTFKIQVLYDLDLGSSSNFQLAGFVIDHDDSGFGFHDGKRRELLTASARGRESDRNGFDEYIRK